MIFVPLRLVKPFNIWLNSAFICASDHAGEKKIVIPHKSSPAHPYDEHRTKTKILLKARCNMQPERIIKRITYKNGGK